MARWQARVDEKLKSYDRVAAVGWVMVGIVGGAIALALLRMVSPSLASTITEHLSWR